MGCEYKIGFGPAAKILDERTERMVGEILTIIEAVVSNDRQVEATKAVVKKYIWNFNRDVKNSFEELIKAEDQ